MDSSLQNRAIRENFDILVQGSRADRARIANQCYTKGLISLTMIEAEISKILQAVQGTISSDATGLPFRNFLEVLRDDQSTEHLAEKIQETLEDLKKLPYERVHGLVSGSHYYDHYHSSHHPDRTHSEPGVRRGGRDFTRHGRKWGSSVSSPAVRESLVCSRGGMLASNASSYLPNSEFSIGLHAFSPPHENGHGAKSASRPRRKSPYRHSERPAAPPCPKGSSASFASKSKAGHFSHCHKVYHEFLGTSPQAGKHRDSSTSSGEESWEDSEDESSEEDGLLLTKGGKIRFDKNGWDMNAFGGSSGSVDGNSAGSDAGKSKLEVPGNARVPSRSASPSRHQDTNKTTGDTGSGKEKEGEREEEGEEERSDSHHVREISSLRKKLDTLETKRQGDIKLAVAKITSLKAQLKSSTKLSQKQARKIEQLEQTLKDLAREKEERESELAHMSRQITYLESYYNDAQARRNSAEEKLLLARRDLELSRQRESLAKQRLADLGNSPSLHHASAAGGGGGDAYLVLKRRVELLEGLLWRRRGGYEGVDGPDEGADGPDEGVDGPCEGVDGEGVSSPEGGCRDNTRRKRASSV